MVKEIPCYSAKSVTAACATELQTPLSTCSAKQQRQEPRNPYEPGMSFKKVMMQLKSGVLMLRKRFRLKRKFHKFDESL